MTHSFGATGEAAELPLGLQPAQAVLAALSLGDLGGNPHPGAPGLWGGDAVAGYPCEMKSYRLHLSQKTKHERLNNLFSSVQSLSCVRLFATP